MCEQCVLYVPHDLILMKRLRMAPALFIVISEVCVYLRVYLCVFAYMCEAGQRSYAAHVDGLSAYFTARTCDKEGEVWKTEESKRGRAGDVCVCV